MVEDDIKKRIFKYWDRLYPITDGVAQIKSVGSISRHTVNVFGITDSSARILWNEWMDFRLGETSHPLHFESSNRTFYFLSKSKGGDGHKLHREDGPAATFEDGRQKWFIYGNEFSKGEHEKIYDIKKPLIK